MKENTKPASKPWFQFFFAFLILAGSQAAIYQYLVLPRLNAPKTIEPTLEQVEEYYQKNLGFLYQVWGSDWSHLERFDRGIDDGIIHDLPTNVPDELFTDIFVDPDIPFQTLIYIKECFRQVLKNNDTPYKAKLDFKKRLNELKCADGDVECWSQVRMLQGYFISIDIAPW